MKKADQIFSEKDKALIADAIRNAEQKTSAEIVPVVASASGRYDRAEDIFGFFISLMFVSIGWLTCPYMHAVAEWGQGTLLSSAGLIPVLITMVAGFAVGSALASYFPLLRLPFTPQKEMDEEVRRAAEAAFMSSKIRKTAGGTGILLYISLYEHRVMVLTDDGITEKLPKQNWENICEVIVSGMKNNKPVEALEEAISRCGVILSGSLPRKEDDVDELGNELVLID